MAGFDVKNATLWPLEISLRQVGPLYWGVTPPGGTFSRGTGAVWFTIQGTISLDGKERTTVMDAIFLPLKASLGLVGLGNWLINGGAARITAATGISEAAANKLVGGHAANTIVINGKLLSEMAEAEVQKALEGIFTVQNSICRMHGCYAGWSGHKHYVISGGPTLKAIPKSKGRVELVAGSLTIAKV